MDDPEVQRDIKHWPFKVKDVNGKPVISVKHKGEQRDFVSCSLTNRKLADIVSPTDSRRN